MSGNKERIILGIPKCISCGKKPKYYVLEDDIGLVGWIHDRKLEHRGFIYNAELSTPFLNRGNVIENLELINIKCGLCSVNILSCNYEFGMSIFRLFLQMDKNGHMLRIGFL